MTTTKEQIAENIEVVRRAISAACERGGRNPDDVQLIAVTKYAELPWVAAVAEHGLPLGENRPQQLATRRTKWPDADWHLIGQLQRNKVRTALQNASLIHSVDSLKLLARIQAVAEELQVKQRVLLQVNMSAEAAKSGFGSAGDPALAEAVSLDSKWVSVDGLMTMAAAAAAPAQLRQTFSSLRILRDDLQQQKGEALPHLSMGMSGDFEIAIEEGATFVRVGRALYNGLERNSE